MFRLQNTEAQLHRHSSISPAIHGRAISILTHEPYTILYYAVLHYTILYYTILYYTILYYTILYYAILYYTILYYTILYYTILYYTILYYTILYYTILYYTILSTHLPVLKEPKGQWPPRPAAGRIPRPPARSCRASSGPRSAGTWWPRRLDSGPGLIYVCVCMYICIHTFYIYI